MPEPVTVYQPWRCRTCGLTGTVEAMSSDDARVIYDRARQQHYERAGANCFGPIRFTGQWQLTKPADA